MGCSALCKFTENAKYGRELAAGVLTDKDIIHAIVLYRLEKLADGNLWKKRQSNSPQLDWSNCIHRYQ